jgi:DNA-binding CsgD family transcriptional regulator
VSRKRAIVVVGDVLVRAQIVEAVAALGWEIVDVPGDARERRRALITGEIDYVIADRTALALDLSPHELALCEAVSAGASNSEIARSLGVSVRTVGARLRLLYRRVGIATRAELVEWYRGNRKP